METGWVTRARQALGVTQAELAHSLGVDRVSVARWESGARRPDERLTERILELVTNRLLARLRHRTGDARRRLPARVSTRLRSQWMRQQVRRLADVLLSGGTGVLSLDDWCRLLWLSPTIVRSSPHTHGLVDGGDVGLAILRALLGKEYANTIGEADSAELRVLGQLRVLHEAQFAAATLEYAVGRMAAQAGERRASNRKATAAPQVQEYGDASREAGRARLVAEAPASGYKPTNRHKTRH